MSNRAWVTLATNDSYGLGALVLAHSLRRASSSYPAVVLITPSVTEAMRDRLRAVFAEVVTVDVLDSQDAAHLALLQRPELGITFTKIHCWGLTQYDKCVFLDADTLVIQNCDELFEREELSAAPDVGWPDCFNSGVFVYKPSQETFEQLIRFAQERGSFDGGDQGLLNSFFSDWAHGDINKHLPFLYNVTSAAFYSYIPALKHYGQNLKIIHFIGAAKPWLQQFNWESRTVQAPEHLRELLQLWWDLFVGQVHPQLDESMVEVQESPPPLPPHDVSTSQHYMPIVDPESEFPWHHPSAQIQEKSQRPEVDLSEFHDPWEMYRGQIPPNKEENIPPPFSGRVEDHEEMKKYAWEYQPSYYDVNVTRTDQETYTHHHQAEQSHYFDHSHQEPQYHHTEHHWESHHQNYGYDQSAHMQHHEQHQHFQHWQHDQHEQHDQHNQHTHKPHHQEEHFEYHNKDHFEHHNENKHEHIQHSWQSHDHRQVDSHNGNERNHHIQNSHEDVHDNQYTFHNIPSVTPEHHHIPSVKHVHKSLNLFSHPSNRQEQIHHVHIHYEKEANQEKNREADNRGMMNGDISDTEEEYYEEIKPRHPYDGFYLRHVAIIDSRGRKVCSHEIPPTPSPTPSPPPDYEPLDDPAYLTAEEFPNGEDDNSGVAGNLARVVPGAPSQREALDELTRRQGWEAGNIDYMGADSFENIWAKISQTLSQPRVSPPKETTPKQPSPPKEVTPPVEVAQEATATDAVSETAVTPVAPAQAQSQTETPLEAVQSEAEKTLAAEAPVAVEAAKVVEAPAPADIPVTVESKASTVPVPEAAAAEVPTAKAPVAETQAVETPVAEVPAADIPATIEAAVEVAPQSEVEIPTTVEACAPGEAPTSAAPEPPKEAEKTEQTLPPTPPVTPKSTPETSTPVTESAPPVAVETQKETASESVAAPQPSEIPSESVEAPKPAEPVVTSQPFEPVEAPQPTETAVTSQPSEPVKAPQPTEAAVTSQPSEPVVTPQPPEPVVKPQPPEPSPESPAVLEQASKVPPAVTPETPTKASPAPSAAATPEKPAEVSPATDSPPLANTPSKEDAPAIPAAKSEERRKVGKLQLKPPAVADPLPTPDSELEDAAALAQSIIASELRTPTVTSPADTGTPVSPPLPSQEKRLSAAGEPEVPTPPIGAVSLSQIGVKPTSKSKTTTAAQIESSVAEKASEPAPTDAPKKKIVKKIVKKESASSGEAPVPPPRKKEKKPKEK